MRERRGHTEACTEMCRLAGVEPRVGVIAEIVEEEEEEDTHPSEGEKEQKEEVEGREREVGKIKEVPKKAEIRGAGGMMRRDGCLAFGRRWGLRVVTIEDLVAFVEREGNGLA